MKRDYESGVADSAAFFVGTEIENSYFYGLRTLFVVGYQDTARVISYASEESCSHVYLGANHSTNNGLLAHLLTQSKKLLDTGHKVTLDMDIKDYPWVEQQEVLDHPNFCLMLSCKVPNIKDRKVCLKLDDIDFKATNPGVWVFRNEKLRTTYNDWSEYGKDKIL